MAPHLFVGRDVRGEGVAHLLLGRDRYAVDHQLQRHQRGRVVLQPRRQPCEVRERHLRVGTQHAVSSEELTRTLGLVCCVVDVAGQSLLQAVD